ncbi:SsgA family sporulation/cell division regulator [Streptomyces sp. NPDC059881]|uniref:SsgA family sporulation/cell division regulator n=1 Tax=Streptomyces sp. NPDC059881 TaxID=3346986 RepID=UPI00364E8D2F
MNQENQENQEKPRGEAKEAVWWTQATHIRADMLLPVSTSFHYTVSDPYAVRITFHPVPDRGPGISWYVERDLLARGTRTRAGDGDVQVRPAPGAAGPSHTLLQIGPATEHALIRIDTPPLLDWLTLTHSLVPPGTEDTRLNWKPFERLLADT